jgi:very-short-patch-repair endonuclease
VEAGAQRYEVTTAARRRDAVREAPLGRAGWTVIRHRRHDVVVDPAPLVDTLVALR